MIAERQLPYAGEIVRDNLFWDDAEGATAPDDSPGN
jgi:hypothetical protein